MSHSDLRDTSPYQSVIPKPSMIHQEEEALVPLVRKRKKKPEVTNSNVGTGPAKKLFSQTINISKVESAGNPTSNKLFNLITQNFNLKTKEDRKLYYIIFLEVKVVCTCSGQILSQSLSILSGHYLLKFSDSGYTCCLSAVVLVLPSSDLVSLPGINTHTYTVYSIYTAIT